MKAFQLNLAKIVAIIYCASIGIVEVFGTPEKHTASNGWEYLIETEYKYNWLEALNECTRRNSQLLIIDSEEKNTVIVNLLKGAIGESRDLWLGGNDGHSIDKEGPFFWSTIGQKFTFTYWGYGAPTNEGPIDHCVHIWNIKSLYRWKDSECSMKMGFICEENSYVKMDKKLKSVCDALNNFSKFERLQKDNMQELHTRLQTLEQMAKEEKSETQKLQNISESSVQQLIDQQELNAKKVLEKLQKQGNELNEQIVHSMNQINDNFDEKFNASISAPNSVKNVVVIKQ